MSKSHIVHVVFILIHNKIFIQVSQQYFKIYKITTSQLINLIHYTIVIDTIDKSIILIINNKYQQLFHNQHKLIHMIVLMVNSQNAISMLLIIHTMFLVIVIQYLLIFQIISIMQLEIIQIHHKIAMDIILVLYHKRFKVVMHHNLTDQPVTATV